MSKTIEALARLGAPIATRKRRGKTVIIPEQWVGHTTHPQQIRKRESKGTAKARKHRSTRGGPYTCHPSGWAPRLSMGRRNEKNHDDT